jgi:uncharacterized protein YggU (UPF0235/DUF167 family)
MARITVRVVPRSGRSALTVDGGAVTIRVRAAPEKGQATEEAMGTLAATLDVPASDVTVFRGRRSRMKVFDVSAMSNEEAGARLRKIDPELC